MGPKLRNSFQKHGGRKFSDTDWLQHMYHGNSNMRFQHCMNSQNSLLYIFVPFKDTPERVPVSPRMLVHCHFNPPIRTHRWRERKQRKKTVSSRFWTRLGTNEMKNILVTTSRSREKFTVTVSGKLLRTPSVGSKGLRFAVIVYNSVPVDRIYKLISKKGNELYSRDSRRLDPHRRLYSKVLGKRSSSSR